MALKKRSVLGSLNTCYQQRRDQLLQDLEFFLEDAKKRGESARQLLKQGV